MRLRLNGRTLKVNGKISQKTFSTLNFKVQGAYFPQSHYGAPSSNQVLNIDSTTDNMVTINYGDGVVNTYPFTFISTNLYRPNWSFIEREIAVITGAPSHYYLDGNVGDRIVSISFANPLTIKTFGSDFNNLRGAFPTEIDGLKNLASLRLTYANFLTTFPYSIANNTKLTSLILNRVGNVLGEKLPDEFFNLPLNVLGVSESVNLSNINTSNLVKIGQLKNTLRTLQIEGCSLVELPNSILDIPLTDLRMGNNPYLVTPPQLNLMPPTLGLLYVGGPNMLSLGDISNQVNLTAVSTGGNANFSTEIPASLSALKKVKTYITLGTFTTKARADAYINNFYDFIVANAAISGSATLPFRGMSQRESVTYSVLSGTYQQPTGYVFGVSNGTPASPREKLWILVNQYLHTWTLT